MTPQTRFLVVDDAEDVRLLMGLGLARAGFESVAEAGTAADALDAARATHPDVVLLDLVLPDGGGRAAIVDLRAVLPDALIVVCSGLQARLMASDCLAAGADAYLEKTDLLGIGHMVTELLRDRP